MTAETKTVLANLRQRIDSIDAELNGLLEQYEAGLVSAAHVRVRELTLKARRETFQNTFNSLLGSIKHF
jgi:hypothetical protein